MRITTHQADYFRSKLPNKEWFSPREVATIIGKTDQYIRDAFDNQKILGHVSNAKSPKGKEQRRYYLIHRDGVILYLLETANYDPEDFSERLRELLYNQPMSTLRNLKIVIENLLRKRE